MCVSVHSSYRQSVCHKTDAADLYQEHRKSKELYPGDFIKQETLYGFFDKWPTRSSKNPLCQIESHHVWCNPYPRNDLQQSGVILSHRSLIVIVCISIFKYISLICCFCMVILCVMDPNQAPPSVGWLCWKEKTFINFFCSKRPPMTHEWRKSLKRVLIRSPAQRARR